MTPSQKTLETKGLVEYSFNDTVVYTFITLWGYSDLWIKDINTLSTFLKRSVHSVNKQTYNVRYLMGMNTRILSDYSELQKEVYDICVKGGYFKTKEIVKRIINDDEVKRNEFFIKRGYNPSKMKLIGIR